MKQNNFYTILAVAFIVAVLCCGGSILAAAIVYSRSSNSVPIASPPTVVQSNTLSYQDICTRPSTMTDIQWNEHLKQFAGRQVIGWTGWVHDVFESGGKYYLYVTFDAPKSFLPTADVRLEIPAAGAMQYEKEKPITVSGIIKEAPTFLGSCSTIELSNATVDKYGP
jgi:hypothetical protein